MQRVLLLMATRTYRARAFMTAAHRLGGEVIVGAERDQALSDVVPGRSLGLDFHSPKRAVEEIEAFASRKPLSAIVGVDDDTTLVAAMASQALGLRGNSTSSVEAAQNKYRMRVLLAEAGEASPQYRLFSAGDDPWRVASQVAYPCVLKPVFLAASRGVIRADNEEQFVQAFERIKAILSDPELRARGGDWADQILVEGFVPGPEVALEGLLDDGQLQVLAIFDKPDPLDGPYFEETIYLTPSRLARSNQNEIGAAVARAARALGLDEGPVHAELRLGAGGPWLIEIAARSIGGLCSTVLEFGTGLSLEDLILRQALGADPPPILDPSRPSGVMMIPIPKRGTLHRVGGRDLAMGVDGIDGIEISIPLGHEVVPVPEGDRYLGFIFAHAETLDAVERALREAHRRLKFSIG
jgi:biotin carboxylase